MKAKYYEIVVSKYFKVFRFSFIISTFFGSFILMLDLQTSQWTMFEIKCVSEIDGKRERDRERTRDKVRIV